MAQLQDSNKKPRGVGFRLSPEDIIKVKQSIAAFCDSEFNPKGLGLVNISEQGFEITVLNFQTLVLGSLILNWKDKLEFNYKGPSVQSMINLYQFYQILENATDDDVIAVYHLFNGTHLSFFFARAPKEELKVEFLDVNPEFGRLPDMEICCEALIKSEFLSLMEQFTNDGELDLVTMDISKKLVTVVVQPGDSCSFQIKEDDQNFGARIFTNAEKYHAKFMLKHLKAMKKASTVEPRFHLICLDDPLGHIMIRFKLEGLGDLVFLHKAIVIMKDPIKCDINIRFG